MSENVAENIGRTQSANEDVGERIEGRGDVVHDVPERFVEIARANSLALEQLTKKSAC